MVGAGVDVNKTQSNRYNINVIVHFRSELLPEPLNADLWMKMNSLAQEIRGFSAARLRTQSTRVTTVTGARLVETRRGDRFHAERDGAAACGFVQDSSLDLQVGIIRPFLLLCAWWVWCMFVIFIEKTWYKPYCAGTTVHCWNTFIPRWSLLLTDFKVHQGLNTCAIVWYSLCNDAYKNEQLKTIFFFFLPWSPIIIRLIRYRFFNFLSITFEDKYNCPDYSFI